MGVYVYSDIASWLLSGAQANNTSGATAIDARAAQPWAIAETKVVGNSAIIDWLYSPNGIDWATAVAQTALTTVTSYLQISAFYPFVNVAIRLSYSGSNNTATAYAYYRAGIGV